MTRVQMQRRRSCSHSTFSPSGKFKSENGESNRENPRDLHVYPIWAAVENLKFILTIRGKTTPGHSRLARHNVCSRFPNHSDIGGMRLIAENFLEILATLFRSLSCFRVLRRCFSDSISSDYSRSNDGPKRESSKFGGGSTRLAANQGNKSTAGELEAAGCVSRRRRYC